MYSATKDIRYLNKFVITAKRMQDRRDDNIASAIPIDFPTGIDWNNNGIFDCLINSPSEIYSLSKAWSVFDGNKPDDCIKTQTFKEAGEICTPMAQFILLLKTDFSFLNSYPLPAEVNSMSASHHNYGSTIITTYEQFANWLQKRIHETIAYFDNRYIQSCPPFYCSLPAHDDETCCKQPTNTVSEHSYYQFVKIEELTLYIIELNKKMNESVKTVEVQNEKIKIIRKKIRC